MKGTSRDGRCQVFVTMAEYDWPRRYDWLSVTWLPGTEEQSSLVHQPTQVVYRRAKQGINIVCRNASEHHLGGRCYLEQLMVLADHTSCRWTKWTARTNEPQSTTGTMGN